MLILSLFSLELFNIVQLDLLAVNIKQGLLNTNTWANLQNASVMEEMFHKIDTRV